MTLVSFLLLLGLEMQVLLETGQKFFQHTHPISRKSKCIGSFTNILAANVPPDLCSRHTSLQ